MEPKEQARAPYVNGINVLGEPLAADYSDNLINVVTFFEPVTRNSLSTVEALRLLSRRYENLSVGFWYVMEPRLSCMFHSKESQMTLDRLSLFGNTLFDANSMLVLQFGIRELPAVLAVDSNGFIRARFEGEIAMRSLERAIQGRLAVSGYRDELPNMRESEVDLLAARGASTLRQLGYVTGDYLFTSLVLPEANQEFALPDFWLVNVIYPHGPWFVGRDFVEGKEGSTVYISCAKDQTVIAFAGSEAGASLRMHTAIEGPQNMVFGKDVKRDGSTLEIEVTGHRPYELLASSGDSDILISLKVQSGSLRLYSVEFCDLERAIGPPANLSR